MAKAFHHFVLHPEEHVDTEISANDHEDDFNEDEFPDGMEHVHEHNDEAKDFLNVLNFLVSKKKATQKFCPEFCEIKS